MTNSLNHSSNIIKIIFLLFSCFSISMVGKANILVLNGLTHENISLPGGQYRDRIEIQNSGTEVRSVKIYARDYWFSYTGESRHDDPGTLARSNTSWINYTPRLITLQPNEKGFIDFEVNVPKTDSLNGTYWSVIMVEGITPPDTMDNSSGVKINTAIRYAVQIITNIGESGKRDLQFLGLELTQSEGKNVLNVVVENTGDFILKPEMSLEVFDGDGNSLGVFKADRRKTFPGTSVTSSIVLEGIKPGKYTAVLVADCDEDHVYGTNISLEI